MNVSKAVEKIGKKMEIILEKDENALSWDQEVEIKNGIVKTCKLEKSENSGSIFGVVSYLTDCSSIDRVTYFKYFTRYYFKSNTTNMIICVTLKLHVTILAIELTNPDIFD